MSEVRGSGLECQAATAQERPRGATLHPRSLVEAKRSYPASAVRGSDQEETPRIRGWGRRPKGATPRPRSVAAGRRHPVSKVRAAARRSYPASEASGGWEETPRV